MKHPHDPGTIELAMPTLIGYARVSTPDEDMDVQTNALEKAGCHRVYTDVASGAKSDRPGLENALGHLREGDTLLVLKIDRLGLPLSHLVPFVDGLSAKGVAFRSLTDRGIDTSTRSGKLIFSALANLKRDLASEQTKMGLIAAAAEGRQPGRRTVITTEKLAEARQMVADGMSVREAATAINVGKTALYNALSAGDDTKRKGA